MSAGGDERPPSRRSSRAVVEHHDALPAIYDGDRRDDAAPHGAASSAPPAPPSPRMALIVIVPILVLIGFGIWQHHQRNVRAQHARDALLNFVPDVRTGQAKRDTGPVSVTLPGEALAFDQASLYARATGYVSERRADIGTRVHKGDLLLRIAAPDLDQQLVQAEAQLGQRQAQLLQAQATVEQAQANTKLAKVTKFRTTTLAAQGWETRQSADQTVANASVQESGVDAAVAGVKVAEANFKAQLATVQRLQALTAFENVRAPFDGVITARGVDTGDLVTADANGGSPLFTVQNDNILRVSVQVPQSAAIGVRDGQVVDIMVPEMPGRHFIGTVSRTAVALVPGSRSMAAEVDIPNGDHLLKPGLYVNVSFQIPRQVPAITVPADALLFSADGIQVVLVGDDGVVHFRPVSVGRDFGQMVEINQGLAGGERIALGLPAGINDGGKIKFQQGKPPSAQN